MQRTENREIPTKQQYWSNLHFLINPTTLASKKCYRYTPLRVRLDPPVIRVHTVGWWLCSLPNYSRICRDDFRYFFFFSFQCHLLYAQARRSYAHNRNRLFLYRRNKWKAIFQCEHVYAVNLHFSLSAGKNHGKRRKRVWTLSWKLRHT